MRCVSQQLWSAEMGVTVLDAAPQTQRLTAVRVLSSSLVHSRLRIRDDCFLACVRGTRYFAWVTWV